MEKENNTLHSSMDKKARVIIAVIGLICSLPLWGGQLPVYLNWNSSNSYLFYKFPDNASGKFKENYNVHFGIDTLLTDEVRTRLDLTNQEKRLYSQVIIDYAMIDYQHENIGLQLAIKDFGYGQGFWLYNRRNDDAFYHKNSLVDYRWHGISSSVQLGRNQFGFGIGSNNLNRTISELYYGFQNEHLNLKAFGVFVPKSSIYSIGVYHGGTELSYANDRISLHSGYVYQYYPLCHLFPQMESWHLTNELGIRLTPAVKVILSSDNQTNALSKRAEHIYEACLDLKYGKLGSYLGASEKTVLNEKAYTYFADLNWFILDKLSIGLFYDYVDFTQSKTYSRIGMQTSYQWTK